MAFKFPSNISVCSDEVVKIGPLGDEQLGLKGFQQMQELLSEAGLELNVQNAD